jgi:FkbM family methyltransferase
MRDYAGTKNINIRKITAFEPDKKNFAKLENNLPRSDKYKLYNIGLWSEETTLCFDSQSGRNTNFIRGGANRASVNALDNIINLGELNNEILIKYDVEGSEFEALNGTKNIIKAYPPKLIVSLYHRNEDIFKLPLLIHGINPAYDFYIRKHKYIPCWDLNLYAVPARI